MPCKKVIKRVFLALGFFLLINVKSFALTPLSNTTQTINPKADFAKLCKVWGLLKYHHPEVIKGKFNWDAELVKILPAYSTASSKTLQNVVLLNWIKGLGNVPATTAVPDSILSKARMKPDLAWIKNSGFSPALVELLTQISNYHVKEKQEYVDVRGEEGVYLFAFTKEDAYKTMEYPTLPYRLLAVYRFWNMIEYWSPYKDLIKKGWQNQLPSFIADAVNAQNEAMYIKAIQKMVGAIQDSHGVVIAKQAETIKGLWKMPFSIKFIEGKAVINTINPKYLSGVKLQEGALLNAVDGKAITKIFEENKAFVAASNEAIVEREIAKLLTRVQDSTTLISVTDLDGKIVEHTIKNRRYNAIAEQTIYEFPYQKDSAYFVLPSGVLYLNAGAVKASHVEGIKTLLKQGKVKGLVLDARQYPRSGSGNLVAILEQSLLPNKVDFAKFASVVLGYPGYFAFATPMSIGKKNPDHFKGKVAILVNEQTQSAAEFIAMAYQSVPNAIVVGSTTAGADGNVTTTFALPGGIFTTFTGLGVFYPDGRQTQQIGIVPTIKVKPTIDGFRKHKDEALERAVLALIN